MKIYTKSGDSGTTSLIGGTRVPKFHERIEAYGTVDELISHIGMLRDMVLDKHLKEILLFIEDKLMICATLLATENEPLNRKLPFLKYTYIETLEHEIDEMERHLEPLHSFILPGGNPVSSQAHICRTLCRRAERRVLILNNVFTIEPMLIQFLNRLSDYFFVCSRYILKIMGGKEIPWKP
jgi:cob(I)alamin adenosyltransferase